MEPNGSNAASDKTSTDVPDSTTPTPMKETPPKTATPKPALRSTSATTPPQQQQQQPKSSPANPRLRRSSCVEADEDKPPHTGAVRSILDAKARFSASLDNLFGAFKRHQDHATTGANDAVNRGAGGGRQSKVAPIGMEGEEDSLTEEDDYSATVLSFVYAILIIVLGLSCPLAEIFANYARMLTDSNAEEEKILRPLSQLTTSFYLYLFLVSTIFCLYVYLFILDGFVDIVEFFERTFRRTKRLFCRTGDDDVDDADEDDEVFDKIETGAVSREPTPGPRETASFKGGEGLGLIAASSAAASAASLTSSRRPSVPHAVRVVPRHPTNAYHPKGHHHLLKHQDSASYAPGNCKLANRQICSQLDQHPQHLCSHPQPPHKSPSSHPQHLPRNQCSHLEKSCQIPPQNCLFPEHWQPNLCSHPEITNKNLCSHRENLCSHLEPPRQSLCPHVHPYLAPPFPKPSSPNTSSTQQPRPLPHPISIRRLRRPRRSTHNRLPWNKGAMSTGSFYMRLGAVAFGIGSMIHDALGFAQLLEASVEDGCGGGGGHGGSGGSGGSGGGHGGGHDVGGGRLTMGLAMTHIAFTFVQLYFIFHNSKLAIHRHKPAVKFGLMHMMSTNLCVWLRTLVTETVVSIHSFQADVESKEANEVGVALVNESVVGSGVGHQDSNSSSAESHCVPRADIMGKVFHNASPYLYPCTIEYSLICAGILFVMWKNVGRGGEGLHTNQELTRRKTERMTVDCRGASRGLFLGVVVLVATIICLIVFFVLVQRSDFQKTAVDLVHFAEMTLYLMALLVSLLAFYLMRKHLIFNKNADADIDDMILVISLPGIFIFSVFGIIAGSYTIEEGGNLVIVTCIMDLIQAVVQTLFILEAMRRRSGTAKVAEETPGRNCVTFLLICNISMWGINVFETQRSDANPYKWHFYGHSAWTIINHIATPLSILYRFHSTVSLSNIWKNAYKYRPTRTMTFERNG